MRKQGFRRSAPLRRRQPSGLPASPGTTPTRRQELQGDEAVHRCLPHPIGPVLRPAVASTRLAVP